MSIMYHVVTDPDDLGGMTYEDFADRLETVGADYVLDQDPEQSLTATEALRKQLASAGWKDSDNDPHIERYDGKPVELPEDAAFAFRSGTLPVMLTRKDGWFCANFLALQEKVRNMSLATFARDTAAAAALKELIDYPFGDMVYLDMGTGPAVYTISSFIRNMEAGRLYYVDRHTVYLH